jgi:hypothetical protein
VYFFSALLNDHKENPSRLEYAAPQKALFRHFTAQATKEALDK